MRLSPADRSCCNRLRKTTHAGQTTVTVTNAHAKAPVAQVAMHDLTRFFKDPHRTAEQLGVVGKVRLIA